MKLALIYFLTFFAVIAMAAWQNSSSTLQVTGHVVDHTNNAVMIRISDIVSVGDNISVIPASGETIMVRVAGERKPKKGSIVIIDLREQISVGENPSSYLMLAYRTVE